MQRPIWSLVENYGDSGQMSWIYVRPVMIFELVSLIEKRLFWHELI